MPSVPVLDVPAVQADATENMISNRPNLRSFLFTFPLLKDKGPDYPALFLFKVRM